MTRMHGFSPEGELSEGAEKALEGLASKDYVDTRVAAGVLGAPVPTAADLPASGERPGATRIAQDTLHLWQWDGSAWVDLGSIQGPPGDGANVTWDTLAGKPTFIAAGSSQATARSVIGAGTSSVTLGTGYSNAARGNHTHDDRYTRHIVLDPGDPVPPGTPEGTLILRRATIGVGGRS